MAPYYWCFLLIASFRGRKNEWRFSFFIYLLESKSLFLALYIYILNLIRMHLYSLCNLKLWPFDYIFMLSLIFEQIIIIFFKTQFIIDDADFIGAPLLILFMFDRMEIGGRDICSWARRSCGEMTVSFLTFMRGLLLFEILLFMCSKYCCREQHWSHCCNTWRMV